MNSCDCAHYFEKAATTFLLSDALARVKLAASNQALGALAVQEAAHI